MTVCCMGPAAHYHDTPSMDRAEKPPRENALKSELKIGVGKWGNRWVFSLKSEIQLCMGKCGEVGGPFHSNQRYSCVWGSDAKLYIII